MKVYIIGAGPGTKDYIIPEARKKIEDADCIIGVERYVRLFRDLGKEEVLMDGHIDSVIPYIKRYKDKEKIVVLVSGDPGMYSLSEKISRALKPKDYDIIPGISTVQLAFAKVALSWFDAKVISLHGRKIDNLSKEIKSCNKVFMLTDADFPPDKIAGSLLKQGIENRRAIVLENLSYPNERVIDTDLERLSRMNPALPKGLGHIKRKSGVKGWGLCAMIIGAPVQPKKVQGKLYGIGIGPGDPGLITLRAKEILDRVDTIFVPKSQEDGASLARAIVEAVTKGKNFVELTFPMTKNKLVLNNYWSRAAGKIVKEIKKGKEAAFVTIGDPLIYSTYIYLLKMLRKDFPKIDIETIPGISAFNAAASVAELELVEGNEKMAVMPVTKDLSGLREALEQFDTIILMKVGSKLDKIISLLNDLGLAKNAVLVSRAGHQDEKVISNLTSLRDKKAGYLSVIIVKKGMAK